MGEVGSLAVGTGAGRAVRMALPRGAAWTTTSTWFAFFTLRRQDAKSFACEFGESRGLTVRYAAKYGMALQEKRS